MDIVLGVSLAPSAASSAAPSSVRMVLVEGEHADGVTVDQDDFGVDARNGSPSEQLMSAILGTRESAREGGYRLTSTGVTVSDETQANLFRDALAERKVGGVTLVSEFLAAVALAQTVGGATGYRQTALLFVEPDSATLAVVDSGDGGIGAVRRVVLPADDASAEAELAGLAAAVDGLDVRPGGLFLVGSAVDVGVLKSRLDAVSPIPISVPEEPDLALARGAALASAHAPLFDSSTSAVAWARDPATGAVDPGLIALVHTHLSDSPVDYDATAAVAPLAYSAVGGDDPDTGYLPGVGVADARRGHRPFLLTGGALAAVLAAVVATLVIALAVGVRPTAANQPVPAPQVIVPLQQAPAAPVQQPAAPVPSPSATPTVTPEPAPPTPVVRHVPAPETPAPAPAAVPAPVSAAVPAPAPAAVPAPVSTAVPAPVSTAVPAPEPAAVPAAAPAPVPAAPVPTQEAPAPVPVPVPIPIPILLPVPASAPAPVPVAPAPSSPPAAPPTVAKQPTLTLPPLFGPRTQTPTKTDSGHNGGIPWLPGNTGSNPWQPSNKDSNPWLPGNTGSNPWLPNADSGRGGGLFPWLPSGGGHNGGATGGGHGGFGF